MLTRNLRCLIGVAALVLTGGLEARAADAKTAARKGLDHYASIMQKGKWGKGGGWCGHYSADCKRRGGEGNQDVPDDVILVQPVGTANIATVFLRASKVLNDPKYMEVTRMAAEAILPAQTTHGGWNYEIWLSPSGPKPIHVWPGIPDWSKRSPNPSNAGTLDDETSFAASEFMYTMWMVTKEEKYHQSWLRSMDFIITCQLPGGGYRQGYPQGSYHAYATFNDSAMLNAVEFMLQAYERTGNVKYLNSVKKCGDFLIRCQTKGGGYGTQHTDSGAVAGARKFEPPGLGPDATRDAIAILAHLYDWTGDPKWLTPLNKAAAWLEKTKIGPNKWARFYHPDSNKPWYRDITGKDVSNASEAKPKYTWQGEWGARGINMAKAYAGKSAGKPKTVPSSGDPTLGFTIKRGGFSGFHAGKFTETVDQIIAAQDEQGRWFVGGRKGGKAKGKKGGAGGSGGTMTAMQWVVYMERLLDSIEGGKP